MDGRHFMRFSVIVPAYNAQMFIDDCVKSVLAQNYSDMELILVNDGSTDSTPEKAEAWAKKDARIRCLNIENSGATGARLAGLNAAKGEFVLYLDADDVWDDGLLNAVDEALTASRADVVMFTFRRVPGNEVHPFEKDGWVEREAWTRKLITTSDMNMVWDKAVRRELALSCPVDASHRGVAEDLLMILPVLDKADRFYYIDRPLYRYRAVMDSRSNSFRANRHFEIDAARTQVLDYLVEKDLNSDENLAAFYTLYADRMLNCLARAAKAGADKKTMKAMFREVRSFPLFQMARFYPLNLSKNKRAQMMLVTWRLDGIFMKLAKRP